MAGNEQLTALLREAGFVDGDGAIARKRFARAVTAAADGRVTRAFTHTYVGRWLNGSIPREETRAAILRALGQSLGRPVHPDEIGFAGATLSPDLGLAYSASASDSAATLAALLQADLDEVPAIVASSVTPTAWSESSLSWLVSARIDPSREVRRIGAADVARVRQTRETFALLDNRFGGGHARRALVAFLRDDLPATLRASASSGVQADLLAASAEITQLAAWASYDAGHHGLAQRYFIQALGLADAAGDRSIAASVLDAMSHQATYLGRFSDAAKLARAALLGTGSLDVPILNAHFHLMEARALARTGDATGCDQALSRAVVEYERHRPGEGPDWAQYVDDAEVAAELAHCQRDLGRSGQAIHWATKAITDASGSYARSDFFATMVLAQAQFDAGLPEEGAETALRALDQGESLRSSRSEAYVVELQERLGRFRGSRVLADFLDQARARRLWQSGLNTRTSPDGSPRSGSRRSA